MSQVTKIENAAFIITVDADRRIVKNGSLLIEDDRITQVAKSDDLRNTPSDQIIDATDMVITPGFLNGHMHISYAHATRGIFPDDLGAAYFPYLFSLQSIMTPEEEYYTSLLALTELLKYGTTTLVDPGSTKHLDTCIEAYRESGCRIIVGQQVTDRPNPWNLPVYTTDEALKLTADTIGRWDGELSGRVSAWAMPFAREYCSDELLTGLKRIVDEHSTGLTIHHSQTVPATEGSQELNVSSTQKLADLGVLGPNVTLAHALGISVADVEIIASSGARVIMCPTAAIKGGSGMTNSALLPELLEAGVPVGLGTDAGNNSNLVESMRAMYLAAVLYKDGRRDVSQIPAETAVELATLRCAHALGLDGDLGSLEEGKKADLVMFDTRRAEWRTLFNPINNLVYNADGRSVHTVMVDGRVVVENHDPTFVDEWELIQKVQTIGENLLERSGVSFPSRWPIV
ncbi:MAG: amidohydrolase family protein [Dehalococcoidia bacterium]|nr:amidohydrolase family protein [Dehalococcoidia bacterium]